MQCYWIYKGCSGGSGKRPSLAYTAPQKEIGWSTGQSSGECTETPKRRDREDMCSTPVETDLSDNIGGDIHHKHEYMNIDIAVLALLLILSLYQHITI